MANVEQLPLVLVVTNNQFAYSTPNVREFGEASLADRGRGYGFTVHETDGTDFMATRKPSAPPSTTRGKAGAPSGCWPRPCACAATGNMTTPPTSPGN